MGTYNRVRVGVVVIAVWALGMAATASATTGTEALNRPPRHTVAKADAKPFLGTYSLTHAPRKIISSTIKTGYNAAGYLQGSISVYEYYQGQPTSFVAALYEYRYQSGELHADLWTPDLNSVLLGRVILRSVAGKLSGSLQLMDAAYAVTYAKASALAVGSAYTKAAVATGSEGGSPGSEPGGTSGLFSTAVVLSQIVG